MDHGHSHHRHGHSHGGDAESGKTRAGDAVSVSWADAKIMLLSSAPAKTLLVYMVLHSIVLLVQFFVSWECGSLALLGHCFFSVFDLGGYVVACISEVYAGQPEGREPFPFGLRRVPVIATFTNSSFLFFTGMFVALEALHRLGYHESGADNTRGLVPALLLGMFLKFCGLLVFRHKRMIAGPSTVGMPRRSKMTPGMRAVMRTTLRGTVAAIGRAIAILASSTVVHTWSHADTLVSLVMSVAMVRTVVPTIRSTSRILLQCTPGSPKSKSDVERCSRAISNVTGVLEIREENVWSIDGETNVGTFCIRANENADEQRILEEIQLLSDPVFKHLTVQVEKDPPTTWFLKAQNAGEAAVSFSAEEAGQPVHEVVARSGMSRTPQRGKAIREA